MKFEIRSRDKRALILLAVAAGLFLLISEIVFPAYDRIRTGSGTVSKKEEELRKYRGVLDSEPHYTQLIDQVKKSLGDGEARLVRGDNPSLASTELQTLVEDAAKKFNIPLSQRTMSAAKKKDEHFNEISMTLSFEGTPNQLTSFLAELRDAPKFVTIRNMQVAPVQVAQQAPTKGELKKTIRVNLTVSALLAAPPAVTPAAVPTSVKG